VVTVHEPAGDWSIFRLSFSLRPSTVSRKNGPVRRLAGKGCRANFWQRVCLQAETHAAPRRWRRLGPKNPGRAVRAGTKSHRTHAAGAQPRASEDRHAVSTGAPYSHSWGPAACLGMENATIGGCFHPSVPSLSGGTVLQSSTNYLSEGEEAGFFPRQADLPRQRKRDEQNTSNPNRATAGPPRGDYARTDHYVASLAHRDGSDR